MEDIKVVKRNSQKKANQLRRHDIVPCCVYGGTLKESISIQMEKMRLNGDIEQFSFQVLSEDKRVNSVAHIKKTPTWAAVRDCAYHQRYPRISNGKKPSPNRQVQYGFTDLEKKTLDFI